MALTVASFSFATVTYKALVLSDRLALLLPRPRVGDEFDAPARGLPQPLLHEHHAGLGAGPAVPHAVPQRRDQHRPRQRAAHARARRASAPRASGSGPRSCSGPCSTRSTPTRASSTPRVELLVRGGRDVRHAVAMLVPEAWEGQRRPRAGGARLLPLPLVPHRAVGRAGRARVQRRSSRRRRARPQRAASAALDVPRRRPGRLPRRRSARSRSTGAAGCGAAASGRARCSASTPTRAGVQLDATIKRSAGGPRHVRASGSADGLRRLHPGEPVQLATSPDDARCAAGRVRRHQGGDGDGAQAHGHRRQGADVLHGRRHPGRGCSAATPRPVFHFLKQRFAQVTQPADRPPPRAAGDVAAHVSRAAAAAAQRDAGRRPPARAPDLLPVPRRRVEALLDPDRAVLARGPARRARSRPATVPTGSSARSRDSGRPRPRPWSPRARSCSSSSDADAEDPTATGSRSPSLLALRGGAPPARRARTSASRRRSSSTPGDARDVHGVACLLGYGADAVCPRLALADGGRAGRRRRARRGRCGPRRRRSSRPRSRTAFSRSCRRWASRPSTATAPPRSSRRSGSAPRWSTTCLPGTASAVGGLGFDALGRRPARAHTTRSRSDDGTALDEPGFFRFRKRGGEYHAQQPRRVRRAARLARVSEAPTVRADELPSRRRDRAGAARRAPGRRRAPDGRDELLPTRASPRAASTSARRPTELHDLLDVVAGADPVPLDEVEPAERDRRALLDRGHVARLAVGGGPRDARHRDEPASAARSNCGEGGEDPARYRTRGDGARPQLAHQADRVGPLRRDARVLRVRRRAQHQDGAGLEAGRGRPAARPQGDRRDRPAPPHPAGRRADLAAAAPRHLLDRGPRPAHLRPQAGQPGGRRVGEARRRGRGRHDRAPASSRRWPTSCRSAGANGGTGASPLSSIKHAGMPWELGLADAQRSLVANGLRVAVPAPGRRRVQDRARRLIAALLGADEYSFGTAAMLAEGCIMVRACHRDTCPTGDRDAAAEPAGQVRRHPRGRRRVPPLRGRGGARDCSRPLGLRTLDEAIGRVDLLRPRRRRRPPGPTPSISALLLATPPDGDAPRFVAADPIRGPAVELDERLLADGFRPLWEGDDERARVPDHATPTGPSARRSAARSASNGASGCRPGRCRCGSPASPARASARSSPTASRSSWSARPTTTSARAWAAGASSSGPRTTTPATRCSRATPSSTARPAAALRGRPGGRAVHGAQQRRRRGGRGHRRPRAAST